MHDHLHLSLAVGICLLLTNAAQAELAVQESGAVNTASANASADEGWSFDDVKDVFEAIHFFAITAGIGVGIWWFVSRYLSQVSILNLDVDIGGSTSVAGQIVVELLATIRNDGTNVASIRACSFSVAAIDPVTIDPRHAVLREGAGLAALCQGEFASAATQIPAGASLRLTAVIAIPANHVAGHLTARVELKGVPEGVTRSRMISFSATSN